MVQNVYYMYIYGQRRYHTMAHKQDPNLVHCASCGEDYSASYKACPFCGSPNTPSPRAAASHQGNYEFDGQDVFDQPDSQPTAKGGKRLQGASGQAPTPPPPINWPRLITFLCSLVIIAAALVMVFTVVYPHLRDVTNPDANPSASVSVSPTATLSPEGLACMTLDTTDITLQPQKTHTLTVTFDPADWEGTVTWTSSDETCATVDENGVVTNVNTSGTQRRAVITATAGGQTVTCTVYCQPSTAAVTPAPTTEPQPTSTPTSESGTISNGSKGSIMNAAGGLRVRSGPGTSYDVLASLKNGDPITVVSDAGDNWYEIEFNGNNGTKTGYIMGDYINAN